MSIVRCMTSRALIVQADIDLTREASADPPVETRRRALAALFSGAALMHTALIGASTVATLVVAQAIGSSWSGAPNAAAVMGTALGTLALGSLMIRWGRRRALLLGYALASLGTVLAIWAVLSGTVVFLVVAMGFIGVGNGAAQMSRYAAADLYPAARRGFALGAVVWAGTVGAVVGPSLIAPAADAARALDFVPLAGPFLAGLVAMLGAGLAVGLMPRHKNLEATRTSELPKGRGSDHRTGEGLRVLMRLPVVRVALTAMLSTQLAMVAVMTMTPLHIHLHGQGLATTGGVLTAHSLGMFALSPLSGRLTDRFGGRVTIVGGLVTLVVSALLTVTAPAGGSALLTFSLFLLGLGWNLNLVGGSGLLSRELPEAERTRVQGTVDAFVWGSSAVASLASGWIFATGGYAFLAVAGGALMLFPAAVILHERRLVGPLLGPRSEGRKGKVASSSSEPRRM